MLVLFFSLMADVGQHTGAAPDVSRQTHQLTTTTQTEAEPLLKKPKEEQIECDINSEGDNFFTICVKSDPEEEDNINMPCIINSFHHQAADASLSGGDVNDGHEDISSMHYGVVAGRLIPCRDEGSTTESGEPQKHLKLAKIKVNSKILVFLLIQL